MKEFYLDPDCNTVFIYMNYYDTNIKTEIETISNTTYDELCDEDEKGFIYCIDVNIDYLDEIIEILLKYDYSFNKEYTLFTTKELE